MAFCTVINCMDGRTQLPVIKYLQKRFNVEYVDSINEPGPNLILSDAKDTALVRSIFDRLKISVENHGSVGVAIVGHHDCAGNPAPKDEQIEQVQKAVRFVGQRYESIEIIGLWVDENWEVHEINEREALMFSKGLSEIVLVVEDVRKAARFYQNVVGLTPEMEANDEWAWFWTGAPNRSQRIALHKGSLLFEEHSPLPEGERWGQVHFALKVPREKLEGAVAHVKDNGVEVYGPTYFEWMKAKSYYFYDLDGNLLEFWSPDAP